jgi:hypothetical protein
MLEIIHREDLITYLSGKMNINYKYSMNDIYKFCDRRNINFAIRYDRDDVFAFLTRKANEILMRNNLPLIGELSQEQFVELCTQFGTDYIKRKSSDTPESIFEYYVIQMSKHNNNLSEIKVEIQLDDIKNYYANASVIDPNTIDMKIYCPQSNELYEFMKQFDFEDGYINHHINKYLITYHKMRRNRY